MIMLPNYAAEQQLMTQLFNISQQDFDTLVTIFNNQDSLFSELALRQSDWVPDLASAGYWKEKTIAMAVKVFFPLAQQQVGITVNFICAGSYLYDMTVFNGQDPAIAPVEPAWQNTAHDQLVYNKKLWMFRFLCNVVASRQFTFNGQQYNMDPENIANIIFTGLSPEEQTTIISNYTNTI